MATTLLPAEALSRRRDVSISFSGLVNGVDYGALVDKLVAAERTPVTALTQRKSETQRKIAIVSDLVTKLKALQAKAKGLDTPSEIRAIAVSSSDPAKVKVTAAGVSAPATYDLRISQLARAQTSRSRSFASTAAGAVADGSIGLKVGAGAVVDVAYTSADTLQAITDRINASGAPVTATLVDDGSGYRLLVTGKDTGVANAISFTGGAELGFTEVAAAQDASFTLNGAPITRPTNTVTGVAPGLTFELLSTTADGTPDVVIKAADDADGRRAKLAELVGAFNDVAKALSAQLAYTGTTKGQDSMFGDSTLQSLQRRLGTIVASPYAHGAGSVSAGQLGLVLGKDGMMTIDATKLDAALATDPTAIEDLLAGSGDGLTGALSKLVDDFTAATTGTLSAKDSGLRATVKSLDERIAQIEDNAAKLGDRLRKQFTALEQVLSGLQGQSDYLTAILYRNNG
jgi:flagellar hook-associated protein 2